MIFSRVIIIEIQFLEEPSIFSVAHPSDIDVRKVPTICTRYGFQYSDMHGKEGTESTAKSNPKYSIHRNAPHFPQLKPDEI